MYKYVENSSATDQMQETSEFSKKKGWKPMTILRQKSRRQEFSSRMSLSIMMIITRAHHLLSQHFE